MTNDFRSYNVIYIVYDRIKNENHWSLLITWNINTQSFYAKEYFSFLVSNVHKIN